MLINSVYKRLPAVAQELGVSAYGFLLRRQRFGSAFQHHLRLLAESEGWTVGEMAEYQDAELGRLLALAWTTVPYYRKHWPAGVVTPDAGAETLAALPILDKDHVRSHPEWFLSTDVRPSDRIWLTTSGTTGSPQRVAVDRVSRQQNYAYLFRLRRWVGVGDARRRAVFVGRILGSDRQLAKRPWRVDYATQSAFFSAYHIGAESVARYVDGLRRFGAEWIEGYPTAIASVARLAEEQGLPIPKMKAVIATCETLTSETRQTIERGFQCRVTDYYGSAEQAAFISECEHGTYHIHPEYGWAELIPAGTDESGTAMYELVTSSFRNLAMPLIRYRTGDLVEAKSGECECGRPFPAIERIIGRQYDVIVTPDGRRVAGIGPALKGLPIRESQLVQVSPDVVEFRFVPFDEAWDADLEGPVLERLHPRLGTAIRIELCPVASLPRGANGKFRMIINATAPSGAPPTEAVPGRTSRGV